MIQALVDQFVEHVGLDAVVFQHPLDLVDLLRDGLSIDSRNALGVERSRRGESKAGTEKKVFDSFRHLTDPLVRNSSSAALARRPRPPRSVRQ